MLQIKIENFEGPLGLLLKLIEKQEMDITKVSLATIADQYVKYIKDSQDQIKPEDIGDFLVVAARLLFVKSKMLLPYLDWGEEEDADELEQQLKIYKEFLEASKKIEEIVRKENFMFFPQNVNNKKRMSTREDDVDFSPPKNLKSDNLGAVFKEIVNKIKKEEIEEEKLEEDKIDKTISIEEKIVSIRNLISKKIKFDFSNILNKSKSKTEVIVSFLAILELSKQEFVLIEQNDLFTPIFLSYNKENNIN
ncbi:segregation/condensation protein A [bacterium]|nr:segregation/condensation protein A [bacterium]